MLRRYCRRKPTWRGSRILPTQRWNSLEKGRTGILSRSILGSRKTPVLELTQQNDSDAKFLPNSCYTGQIRNSLKRGVLYHRWRQRTNHSETMKRSVERERSRDVFHRKVFRTPFESEDSVWVFSQHKRKAACKTSDMQVEPPDTRSRGNEANGTAPRESKGDTTVTNRTTEKTRA